ncbi:RimJ/RimL family protein N-acetyltransferase [Hasllibacter halocynthiae]|uniref:RimJ/RimL family protein N-acetyltransferase n=1 Tax=Hasllibacter halocynthiae TaxID=595589 RepID=A0A2T0X3L7_9RHOB|nr:GNAT family N-acetyltransferase [Hasllibacter halocynthiae]PRY93542.1 RimJ/RimL family protein N-acetyltransferase [Hasllibacter halocynthiae]
MSLKTTLPPREPPFLRTDRLALRPHRRGDWPAYAAFMASDRAAHIGGPYDAQAAWGWFCSDFGQWGLTGTGALAVDRGGETVGQVVFNDLPTFPEFELGWLAFEGHEGHGYLSEAASAFRDWIREEARPPSLVSYVSPDNARSLALAERLGARRDEGAPAPSTGDVVMRHWGAAA